MVMQVTCRLSPTGSRMCRLQLYSSTGLMGPSRAASCTAHTAAAVTQRWASVVLGMHSGQDTLNRASALILVPLPYSIIKNFIWPSWPPNDDSQCPAWLLLEHRSGDYYLCRCQRSIHRGIWEFLDHSPLEGEKLQFVGGVVGFSLCQTPTNVVDDGISAIIMSLTEDSPQARPTSISMELKRPHEISIGKNRHCGAQVLQVIKGPLTPVIPCDDHFFLACIFT